jgi:hypothetical protein
VGEFAIKVGRFEFSVRAKSPIILHAYPGSTIRGAFGIALKKVVCALKNKECATCILRAQCIYSYVFETPPNAGARVMKKYLQVPRPFILEPPLEKKIEYQPGENLSFGLTLIGDRAMACCPYFIYAFDELGRVGIGADSGRFELKTVRYKGNGFDDNDHVNGGGDAVGDVVYSAESKTYKPIDGKGLAIDPEGLCATSAEPRTLAINFLTPTRIYYKGSLTAEPEFHILIRNLQRRVAHLAHFHCGIDTTQWDFFTRVINRAKRVQIKDQEITWRFWERYSTRQQAWVEMSGFVGRIKYHGSVDPFVPLLKAGEVLHVGKGTTFGLGRYYIE